LTPRRAGTVAWAAAAIVLLALTLRIAVASLSPLLTVISRDFALPAAVVGLIGMAPPVAFALSAVVTPAIERRVGLERLVLIAAVAAAAALGLRVSWRWMPGRCWPRRRGSSRRSVSPTC